MRGTAIVWRLVLAVVVGSVVGPARPAASQAQSWTAIFKEYREFGGWVSTSPAGTIPISRTNVSGTIQYAVPAEGHATGYGSSGSIITYTPPLDTLLTVTLVVQNASSEDKAYTFRLYVSDFWGDSSTQPCRQEQTKTVPTGSSVEFSLSAPCPLSTLKAVDVYGVLRTGVVNSISLRQVGGYEQLGPLSYTAWYEYSSAMDIDPAVCRNTVPSAEKFTAKITGSGFVQGSTVKIGTGDVKVLTNPARFVSATQLEIDIGDFQNLANGPRDVEVTKPDGTKVKGTGIFFVSSLEISPLEINQGVKIASNCTTQLPCVADHRTVVRAKVVCNAASCPSNLAMARLHVFQAGTQTPIAGSPYAPSPRSFALRPKSQAVDEPTRFQAKDTLNFAFKGDRALLAGSYDFVFEVNPRSPSVAPSGPTYDKKRNLLKRADAKVFQNSTAMLDVYIMAEPKEDGSEDWKGLMKGIGDLRFLKASYPASGTAINIVPISGKHIPRASQGLSATLLYFLTYSNSLQRNRAAGNPAHALYLAAEPFKTRGRLLYNLADAISFCALGGRELGTGCRFPGGLAWKHSVFRTADHLLGHDYGLGDYDSRDPEHDLEPFRLRSPLNPLSSCPSEGCDCEDGNYNTIFDVVSVPPTWALDSFMSSSGAGSFWVEKRTWDLLYTRLMAQSPPARPVPLATQDLLVVTGAFTSSGTAAFGPFSRLVDTTPAAQTGDYAVELQNASQQVLSSATFGVDLTVFDSFPSGTELPFLVRVPWAAGTTKVVLKRGSTVLATRNVSANPPTVTLTYPVGGETISGTATIRWSGSDPNGDALSYSVYYSTDNASWLPIALGVTGTTLAWDTSIAKGSTTGRIKVVASDGVNEASATSGAFTVTSKGPSAVISAPADGTVVLTGEPVTLEGAAFDTEDGLLSGSSLVFSSSRDGALGTGESVSTDALSAGIHTITLTATDSNGNKATATITLNVFTPGPPPSETAFAPIVLSTAGLNGSYFTSELTLTNRGSSNATVELDYTSAFGGGTGVVYDTLLAGRQKIVHDAIAYLTNLGLDIPAEGNRGGTLRVRFYGLSSATAGSATIRTTTAVSNGRAGLSYPAIPPALLTGTAYLCGLRQTATDRSNLALLNVGSETDGNVTLRPTVTSGNPSAPQSKVLPDVTLAPGGFNQISQVLASNGLSLTNGYVKVERVSGTAPFYTYAVINDQANSDGSFVPPVLSSALSGKKGISLPVAVETSSFATELVVTNFGTAAKTVKLTYVASAVSAAGNETSMTMTVAAGEQKVLPSFVQALRDAGAPGIGAAGTTYAGAVFLTVASGDVSGLFIGGRTSAAGGGGRYGLFYTGVPFGAAATDSAWLYGLQQDAENRTNLAIVNTGETDASPSAFRVDLWDGDTGGLVNSVGGISIPAKGWAQLSSILKTYAPNSTHAYAKVSRAAGTNPFLTYAVINDGGAPNQRSDDGAFVAMDLADQPASAPSLEVTPTSLAFESVTVGQTKDLTVTVKNKGTGTLTGTATTSAPFSVTGGGSFSLAANATQTVTVRYAPTAVGAGSGSLSLSSNGGSASVALSGTGTSAAAPQIEVTPTSLAFESVTVGQTKDMTVTVKNKGTGTLTGTATTAAPFSVTGGASFSLAASATQTVTVRYAPTAAGAGSGTLSFSSNGGNASATLSGTGTSPQMVTQELSTDDGSAETGVVGNGLIIVNRLTPPRFPATLQKIRVYFAQYTGLPSPVGAQIKLVAFSSATGAPPASPTLLVNTSTSVTATGWVDYTLASPVTISAGDFYVGYQAPNPYGGVGFAADSSGTQQMRGYFSSDGGAVYQGPLVLVGSGGQQTKINIMIRAVVSVPGP